MSECQMLKHVVAKAVGFGWLNWGENESYEFCTVTPCRVCAFALCCVISGFVARPFSSRCGFLALLPSNPLTAILKRRKVVVRIDDCNYRAWLE